MSYDDFCRLTPAEFNDVIEAYNSRQEESERAEWERMRLAVTIIIQPHVKKRMRPQELIPFPWDNETLPKAPGRDKGRPERLTREEQYKRMKHLTGGKV